MVDLATLPFTIKRGDDIVGLTGVSSRSERVDGLLRFDGRNVTLQWRVQRTAEVVGSEIRTDRETTPVSELTIPLAALSGAEVKWMWFRWPPGPYAVIRAANLTAFEKIAGAEGLSLTHPAELYIPFQWRRRQVGQAFAGEIEMALADRALRAAEEASKLPGPEEEEPASGPD